MVAVALSTMFAVAITGMIRTLVERREFLQQQEKMIPLWKLQLRSRLSQDFELANKVSIVPAKIELEGFMGIDQRAGTFNMNRARVEYFIVELPESACLVRKLTNLDSHSNQNSQTEVVATGVKRIAWEGSFADQVGAANPTSSISFDRRFRYRALVLYDISGDVILKQSVRFR